MSGTRPGPIPRPRRAQLSLFAPALLALAGCPAPPGATPAPSAAASPTPTAPGPTASPAPTATAAATPGPSPTAAPTPTAQSTPTVQPATPTPTATQTPTAASPTPTASRACAPALELSPAQVQMLTYDLLTFAPSGGTGAYRFALASNGSGAIVNPVTGAYLSGGGEGTQDVLRLTDGGCVGSAEAVITVVRDMTLLPAQVQVAPGGAVAFEVQGGSGSYACEMLVVASGAQVSQACVYTAGTTPGRDVVRVVDLLTGQVEDADVEVAVGAGLQLLPPRMLVPVGSSYVLKIAGGSGEIDVQMPEGCGPQVIGQRTGALTLLADQGCEAELTLVDRFTGARAVATVQAVESLGAPALRVGDQTMSGEALAPGDLDGDGYADAILTLPEGDLGGYNGGAVYVYAGSADGLAPAPVQIFYGDEWESELGRGIWVGDLDADGQPELVTGAYREDRGATDVGVVRIHKGLQGGFFEEQPYKELVGPESSAWFGYSVAACDLDQDGHMDLVVGTPRFEDDSIVDAPSDTGALLIYHGGPYGFADEHDAALYGLVTEGGGWSAYRDAYMGTQLKAADLNGDGRCDLVAGAWQIDPPQGANTGAAMIYFGRGASAQDPLGYGPTPDLMIAPTSAGGAESHFTRRIAVGDLDGDGADDLAVAQWRYTAPDGGSFNGAMRVYTGAQLSAAGALLSDEDAAWSVIGPNRSDYSGWVADIADVDADGRNELLVGDLQGEVAGGTNNLGRVAVYATEGEVDALSLAWEIHDPALASGEFFGQAVATLGDADGDGAPDLLVLAGRSGQYGYRVGAPYFVSGQSRSLSLLEMPGEPSGAQLGRGTITLLDLNGDGALEVVGGAPYADPSGSLSNAGEVYVFEGAEGGPSTSAGFSLQGFEGHGNGDLFGWAVASGGDFDGDGAPDLAVAASGDDSPSSFGAAYTNPTDCAGTRSNPGAVFIFEGDGEAPLATQPSFVYYGPLDSGQVQRVAGGMDLNGDGYGDFVAATNGWDFAYDNTGGAAVVFGRPSAEGITILCDEDLLIPGTWDGGQAGMVIAGLGDLDGDGCDELGIGAPFVDQRSLSNQGQVMVVFGWGGGGCPANPEAVTLLSGIANSYAGYGLDGGHDVDGDGVPDLLIGAPNLDSDGDRPGGAFVLSGAAVAALDRQPFEAGVEPAAYVTFAEVGVLAVVIGGTHGGDFGKAVALAPGASGGGRAGLLIGEPEGEVGGEPITGGAWLYALDEGDGQLKPRLLMGLGGERSAVLSLIGEVVAAGQQGGDLLVVTGGYRADGSGLDQGALYLGRVPLAP